MHCLRELLDIYARASGLVTNYDNLCILTPIQCSQEQASSLLQVFPCTITEFSCGHAGTWASLSPSED